MKKFLLFVAAAMAVTLLSAPMAYAAPSPTEPDRPPVELEDPNVPLVGLPKVDFPVDIDKPAVRVSEMDPPVEIEIDDPEVPLAFLPAPQTGVTGLSGMESLTLAAVAFAVSGAVILVKARKQTGSVR